MMRDVEDFAAVSVELRVITSWGGKGPQNSLNMRTMSTPPIALLLQGCLPQLGRGPPYESRTGSRSSRICTKIR